MDNSTRQQFDRLCSDHNLKKPLPDDTYRVFLLLLDDIRNGRFTPDEKAASDFSALESAIMLKQIYNAHCFMLKVGKSKYEYSDPFFIKFIVNTLISELQKRIIKSKNSVIECAGKTTEIGPVMYLNIQSENNGVVVRIPYPKGEKPFNNGFSSAELDAIIENELLRKKIIRKYTRNNILQNPALGHLCDYYLTYLPEDWSQEDKQYFIFEFFIIAGLLNDRGQEWITTNSNKEKNDKTRIVKDWINAFRNLEQD